MGPASRPPLVEVAPLGPPVLSRCERMGGSELGSPPEPEPSGGADSGALSGSPGEAGGTSVRWPLGSAGGRDEDSGGEGRR